MYKLCITGCNDKKSYYLAFGERIIILPGLVNDFIIFGFDPVRQGLF